MKNRRRISITLATLIIGTTWLVACGGDGTPAKMNLWPHATATPAQSSPNVTALPSPTTTASPTELAIEATLPIASGVSFSTPTRPAPSPTAAPTRTPTHTPTHTPTPPHPTPPPPAPAIIQYTVQAGDSLWGLASQHGVSMAAIQLANDLGDATGLVAGQTLDIPGSPQWPEESTYWVIHVVRPGETLVGLASAYELEVDQILRVNAIADPSLIHPEQQLVLPLTGLATTNATPPTATPAALAAASTQATMPAPTTPATAPTAQPTAPPPALPPGAADWSGYILARINQVRAEHGLNTLTIAPELTQAAQAHAQDCARRGWGSHVGSDGAVLKTRLERAGYFGKNWGENWVQALNAERAFDWWYGEIPPNDPHRRNILSSHYTEVGIGIAQMEWGYVFITDLGRR